ncbi:MAG: hypothetical protein JWM68_1814, partial [Verrucomicrobiales bacterium]|nr:hypothetical protein [Verrucomicrobiales bacterium]
VPHPETGEVIRDLESAKFFIDQIEMIEVKTKGNLDKREEDLLKQSLTTLRMAFVEAVEHPEAAKAPQKNVAEKPTPSPEPHVQPSSDISDEDSKKKFSKKY